MFNMAMSGAMSTLRFACGLWKTAGGLKLQATKSITTRHSSTVSFKGVFPIMATPFNKDETLDVQSFCKALMFVATAGADGATIVGVLGESNRLTDNERETLVKAAVQTSQKFEADTGKRFPIIVGTSHAGTYATRELTKMALSLGASGVMVTPSKEPSPVSPNGLVEYYGRVAEGSPGFPIVLQDHPASTQVHMSIELVHRITCEIEEIKSVKLEALPSPPKVVQLRSMWEDAPSAAGDCTILTGLGALYGAYELDAGADGFMTGFAFPEILKAMVNAAHANDSNACHQIYQRFLPLMVFEQQPGVAVRKAIYSLRGLIDCEHVRHPAANISSTAMAMTSACVNRSLPGVDVTKPIALQDVMKMSGLV